MMFNTVNYQRNANKTHNGQFLLSRMAKIKIKAGSHKMESVCGKCVPQFVNGSVKWCVVALGDN